MSVSNPFGRAVFVALDHGLHWGVYEGFEDPGALLDRVLEAGPDGVLASVPFLRRFRDRLDAHDVYTVGTLDLLYDSTLPGGSENAEIHTQIFEADEAAEVADAAKMALVYGREDPSVLQSNVEAVASAARDCREVGIPLVVEATLWGQRIDDEFDPEYLGHTNRLAFELGADILKSPYPQTGFGDIVDNAPKPVYIAGGPAADTDREVLEMVRGARDAGASGVMFGRNIWQRNDPAGIIEAFGAIVHEDASVDTAGEFLE